VQDVSGGEPIEVFQGMRGGPVPPRWSPNGSQLIVSAAKGTFIVPSFGGTPLQIAPRMRPSFPVWHDEFTIVGIDTSVGGLAIVARDVGTGERTAVCDLPDVKTWWGFDWSPAQNAFLVVSTDKNVSSSLRTFRSGDCRSTLIVNLDGPQISQPRWASDGKAIYYVIREDSAGALWKVRVGSSAEPLGTPMLVRDGITGPFSMSSNNTLVHERRTTSSTIAVVSDAKAGAVVRPITEGTAVDTDPEFSPDGTRIAFARRGNIYITSDDGRPPRRMTSSFKTAAGPVWSPDARRIAFRTREGGAATIWTVDVDAGTLRSFAASVRMRVSFSRLHWAPAAEILFFDVNDDISAVDPESGAVRLLTKPFGVRAGPLQATVHPSPDHSRVVVQSALNGSDMTYKVYAFSDGGGVTDERNLLRRPDARYGPVIGWASDDWIYVHGENPREILRIPAAGGLATHVVTLPEPPLAVSSISTRLGVTRFVGTLDKTLSDIWLTENFDQDR
jgi:Tol biopolymer transport system component